MPEGSGPRLAAEGFRAVDAMRADLAHPTTTLRASFDLLSKLFVSATEVAVVAAAGSDADVQWWAAALLRSIADHRDEILGYAPWLSLPPAPSAPNPSGTDAPPDAWGAALQMLDGLARGPSPVEIAALQQEATPSLDAALAARRR